MKAGLCVLVLVLVGAIAALVWRGGREKERAQQRVMAAQSQAEAAQTELEQSRVREKQLASLPPQVVVKTSSTPVMESHVAVVETKPAPRPAMLKDPETRALMRKQQQQAMTKGAEKMISSEFARTWNLTPEQVTNARAVFIERGNASRDMLNAMMFDGLDDQALAERGRETKDRVNAAETGLRDVLGVDAFNGLREQEQANEERERVRRMRDEIASTGEPLTKEQEQSLLAAFASERQGFTFRVDLSDPSKVDYEHIRDFFSQANLDKYFEDVQQLNARVAERAALILSAAQLEQFRVAQNNRLDQARLTVRMTTELFNKPRGNN